MPLDALILSSDSELVNAFRDVLGDAGVNMQESVSVGEWLKRLASQRYDAVIVDCEGSPESASLIGELRKGESNKTTITFAVVGQDAASVKSALDQGATFVLHKPISTDTVLRSLRASHGLIVKERRKHLRHPVDTHAYLQTGRYENLRAGVTDISAGGCALVLPFREQLSGEGNLKLALPNVMEQVEGKIEVMWCTAAGQAGIRFVQLTKRSEQLLSEWLQARADVPGLARHFTTAKRKTNF